MTEFEDKSLVFFFLEDENILKVFSLYYTVFYTIYSKSF